MNANFPKITPIISTIFQLFSLMLLLNTSVSAVLAGDANLLAKQPELKENSSERNLVNEQKRNKDDDDDYKQEDSQDNDDDDDDDNDNDNDNDD